MPAPTFVRECAHPIRTPSLGNGGEPSPISIKGGKYRTGSQTPVGFTVLDATPVSAPTNDYTNDHTNNVTNHNGQFDFMDQNAELGAASAALAARSSRTGPRQLKAHSPRKPILLHSSRVDLLVIV